MIGVVANLGEEAVAREFFELFKTPWEFLRPHANYDVVLSTSGHRPDGVAARLFILFSSASVPFDREASIAVKASSSSPVLSYRKERIPLSGNALTFNRTPAVGLTEEKSSDPAMYSGRDAHGRFVRVGYNLFEEIRNLLVAGQPLEHAASPTVELHIAFLRNLILGSGIPLLEIPPTPSDCTFIACLTHDMDHASIRRHRFDPTMLGFLYRATLGAFMDMRRGRLTREQFFTNLGAAAKLPFIYLGLAEDFWGRFDRYLDLEAGRPSTFYVIPYEHKPGMRAEGPAPRARGSGYDVSHIGEGLRTLAGAGCEIGLHGIDAWRDTGSGKAEAQRIADVSGTPSTGVRMHWLYNDESTPRVLEDAGFAYDSTIGYNETIGYRAGTIQAFKPLSATRLMELPMHVMDTALFYPSYLNLSPEGAWQYLLPYLDNAIRFGGVMTFNWHDRSIAPERLWGDFYSRAIAEMTRRGAWFCTAAEAVEWFRRRRDVRFADNGSSGIRVEVPGDVENFRLRLRVYRPHRLNSSGESADDVAYEDSALAHSVEVVPLIET